MSQKSNGPTILLIEPLQIRVQSHLSSTSPNIALTADKSTIFEEIVANDAGLVFSPADHFLNPNQEDCNICTRVRRNQNDISRFFPIQIERIETQPEEEMRPSKSQQRMNISKTGDTAIHILQSPNEGFFFQLVPDKQPQLTTPGLEKVNVEEALEDFGIRASQTCLNISHHQKNLQEKSSSEEKEKRVLIHSRREFLKGPRLSNLRMQVSRNVPPKETLVMSLVKSSHILSYFWPEFQLRFKDDQKPLMAGKRISVNPYSTYIISTSPNDFDLRSSSYIGKVKTSLLGTVVNIYGPGLSPSAAARQHEIPREVLATIVYLKVQAQAPRQFTLFVKKQQFHYYLAFPQVKLYGPEISLNELYKDTTSRSKIEVYTSRIPVFDPKAKSYILNFHGNVQCPSVRNFILEDECGEEVMLLGKSRNNHFNVEISHSLSPLVGFGVAMSSFESLWL